VVLPPGEDRAPIHARARQRNDQDRARRRTPEKQAAIDALLKDWADKIAKYDSELESGEGRKELMARAKAAEADRDKALAANNDFGYASAALPSCLRRLRSCGLPMSPAGSGWLPSYSQGSAFLLRPCCRSEF
jgi:hypothetical protein